MDFLRAGILFCHSLNNGKPTFNLPTLSADRQALKPANMRKISSACCVICFFLTSILSSAQNHSSLNRLKVFIDCKAWNCPFDYIRSEINFVDYVNDRYAANVFILLTSSTTGGGGQEYNIYFEGLEDFKSLNDTLTYVRTAVETDDEDRKKMVQVLKLGLVRYLAKTSMGSRMLISMSADTNSKESQQTSVKKDKWNAWVFNTGLNGNFSGNDNYGSSYIRTQLNASRVTEKLKLKFSTNYSTDKNKYIYNDYDTTTGEIISSTTTKSTIKRSNVNGTVAMSINSHWSAGLFSNYLTSTFSNIKRSMSLKPALEYSIYPYKAFNTKYMGFLYKIGPLYNAYEDTSWRNKNKEWLLQQNLSFDMNFTQKWGSVSGSLYWANYFFDWRWNNYGFFGQGQFRIVKGLNFNFFGGFSIIHDQVELPKDNATQTQVLIRQRILRNTSEYFVGMGLSYRFGSIFNNVVNPRLGEAGGGFFFFDQ